MSSRQAIESKIQEQAERLERLVNPEDKRIKKRILQNLGKLKKQLAQLGDTDEEAEKEKTSQDIENNESKPLTKKQAKLKIKIINKEIADYALKKQLKSAKKRFDWAIRKGLKPDVHTYTNLLNTYVRCKNIAGAEGVWKSMILAGVEPNVVTYTNLIRGYCEVGKVAMAKELLISMLSGKTQDSTRVPPVPNVRTLNTFLRGCVRVGAVRDAVEAFEKFRERKATNAPCPENSTPHDPNEASFEYVISLLCRALDLAPAMKLAEEFMVLFADNRVVTDLLATAEIDSAPPLHLESMPVVQLYRQREIHADAVLHAAAIFSNLARALALLRRCDQCTWCLLAAEECLRACQSASVRLAMQSHRDDGKSHDRDASVGLFMQHRKSELARECGVVRSYNSISVAPMEPAGTLLNDPNKSLGLMACYCRLLLLLDVPSSSISGEEWRSELLTSMLTYLGDAFGLNRCKSLPYEKAKAEVMQRIIKSIQPTKEEGTTSSGYCIDFSALLQQVHDPESSEMSCATEHMKEKKRSRGSAGGVSKRSRSEENTVSVKMEICSGSGEWVVEQAIADQKRREALLRSGGSADETLWVALEVRVDRVHQTFSQAVLRGAETNLAIIGGDAGVVLPTFVPSGCLSTIFVNHPEPPERTSGGEDMSQGSHLLTASFFLEMHRVLRRGE